MTNFYAESGIVSWHRTESAKGTCRMRLPPPTNSVPIRTREPFPSYIQTEQHSSNPGTSKAGLKTELMPPTRKSRRTRPANAPTLPPAMSNTVPIWRRSAQLPVTTRLNTGQIRWLYPFPPHRFHVLFNSLFKVLCNFPSQYLFAIGLVVIFSLR